MTQLNYTTAGTTGFDMRELDFNALLGVKTVLGFNAFSVLWMQPGSSTHVSLSGENLVADVASGVLNDLTGGMITTLSVQAGSFNLGFNGLAISATGFWDLVQAQDWVGLAEFVRTGDDTILGTANADYLLGGDGNDIFNPGLGDDVLKGGRGADTMRWSEGHDVLTGGQGADVFLFEATPVAEDGDRVTDFKHGVDRFHISDVEYNDVGHGGFDGAALEAVHFIKGRQATTEDHAIVYNQNREFLYYDPDGVGGLDHILMAKLGAGTMLDASDFWVI